jgi:biotin carboxyl carrier protein
MALEAAQHVKCTRHHLDYVALTCTIAGVNSLFAEPLRASSHGYPIPLYGMKFHLQKKLPQAICDDNKKPRAPALRYACISLSCAAAVPESGMPEIKIVTEVAGRICALPVQVGGSIEDGDDLVFVEAMKMEIPVAAPAAGRLKSILVAVDDVVAEGQVLAIIET